MSAEAISERQKTGLHATYQAEAILRAMLHAAHHLEAEELPSLIQGMLPRLLDLNGVSMIAHQSEDTETLESMLESLHGGYARHSMPINSPA